MSCISSMRCDTRKQTFPALAPSHPHRREGWHSSCNHGRIFSPAFSLLLSLAATWYGENFSSRRCGCHMQQGRFCRRSRYLLTSLGCTPISTQRANVHSILRRRPGCVLREACRDSSETAKQRTRQTAGRGQGRGRQGIILLTIEAVHHHPKLVGKNDGWFVLRIDRPVEALRRIAARGPTPDAPELQARKHHVSRQSSWVLGIAKISGARPCQPEGHRLIPRSGHTKKSTVAGPGVWDTTACDHPGAPTVDKPQGKKKKICTSHLSNWGEAGMRHWSALDRQSGDRGLIWQMRGTARPWCDTRP